MSQISKILILYALLITKNAWTLPSCYHNDLSQESNQLQSLIEKTAIYGKVDGRKTEDDFAKANSLDPELLKAKLSATGLLKCGAFEGTAQLTGSSKIITTVAHMIYNSKTCRKDAEPSQCSFTYTFEGKAKSISGGKLIGIGYKCGHSSAYKPKMTEDWAVIELPRAADGPIPYRVRKPTEVTIQNGQPIISVAEKSLDFCIHSVRDQKCLRDSTGRVIHPKHVEACTARKVYSDGETPVYFVSDCANSLGSSGGSILDADLEYPTLLGIIKGSQEDEDTVLRNANKGIPQSGEFDENKWSNHQVPVAGEFLETILRAEGQN